MNPWAPPTRGHEPLQIADERLGLRQPVIVVASGKGGAGKSVVSILLAKTLVERGHNVLLVEGDQNRGSLHVLLGVRPLGRLEDVVGGVASPDELITPIIDNLSLVSGDTGADGLYALTALDRARIHGKLQSLYDQFEVVVVDSAPDHEGTVRACSMGASRLVIVTVAEPAALSDTYAVMKTVHHQVPYLPMDIMVNRVSDNADGRKTFALLYLVCRRFLECTPRYVGAIPEDGQLRTAVSLPGVLSGPLPDSDAVQRFRTIFVEQQHEWCEQLVDRGTR